MELRSQEDWKWKHCHQTFFLCYENYLQFYDVVFTLQEEEEEVVVLECEILVNYSEINELIENWG